jgi:hypothetical protein
MQILAACEDFGITLHADFSLPAKILVGQALPPANRAKRGGLFVALLLCEAAPVAASALPARLTAFSVLFTS